MVINMEYSNLFVCLMGLGTVFFGLICIILLSSLMSFLCRSRRKPFTVPADEFFAAPGQPGRRQEMIAALSAALAEDLGTDLSGIRILSLKKV